jgi:hypothetical protein
MKKAKLMLASIGAMLGMVLAGQGSAMAQIQPVSPPGSSVQGTAPITSVGQAVGLLQLIVNWVFYIFWMLVGVFILWAAFDYLMAGGDPKKTESAKNKLIYAVIAIVVALLSTGLKTILSGFLTTGA